MFKFLSITTILSIILISNGYSQTYLSVDGDRKTFFDIPFPPFSWFGGNSLTHDHMGFPLKKDRVIVFDDNTVTVTYKKSAADDGYEIRLLCLKTPSNDPYEELKIENKSSVVFRISGFKSPNVYHYRLIRRKKFSDDSTFITKADTTRVKNYTLDTSFSSHTETTVNSLGKSNLRSTIKEAIDTLTKRDSLNYYKTIITLNTKNYFKELEDSVIQDFNIEAHQRTLLELSFGIFNSSVFLPEYSLVRMDSANGMIQDNSNGRKSSGVTIGAVYYPWGHDDNIVWNSNIFWLKNVIRNIGFYGGVGYSFANKSYQNYLFGLAFSFTKFKFIIGYYRSRISVLQSPYSLNKTYPFSSNFDINSILGSQIQSGLFFGGVLDETTISALLGYLGLK